MSADGERPWDPVVLPDLVDLDEACAHVAMSLVMKSGTGWFADGEDDGLGIQELAVGEQHALVRDLLGEAGPAEGGADGLGVLLLLAVGGGPSARR